MWERSFSSARRLLRANLKIRPYHPDLAARRWAVSVKITYQIDHITNVDYAGAVAVSGVNRGRSGSVSVEITDQIYDVSYIDYTVAVDVAGLIKCGVPLDLEH